MPQEDFTIIECRKCSIELTNENKVKKQNLCRSCNKIICKEYKQKNKKVISDYNKKYKSEHKEEITNYNQQYNISNRESIQKRHTVYLREKRKSDPHYKISVTCRNRIKKLIKGEHKSSTLIDCNADFLIEWLSSNFNKKMTLQNHGEYWHIDHVIPCNSFDLTKEDDLKKCFHWTNLQPLEAMKNLSKKDKIDSIEIKKHWLKVNKFIKSKKIEAKYSLVDYDSYITTPPVKIDGGPRLIAVPKGKKV
jgi:hypothetical protein